MASTIPRFLSSWNRLVAIVPASLVQVQKISGVVGISSCQFRSCFSSHQSFQKEVPTTTCYSSYTGTGPNLKVSEMVEHVVEEVKSKSNGNPETENVSVEPSPDPGDIATKTEEPSEASVQHLSNNQPESSSATSDEPQPLSSTGTEVTATTENTSANDSTTTTGQPEPFKRVRKRKLVLLLSYCGQGFYGMQVNPGTRTIESELFKAFRALDYIDDEGLKRPQSFQFQRAARTDKSVSAARQIVSLKGPENMDVAKLNEVLPTEVRVMGMKRVTKGFDSKQNCDARTYSYMIPTFAFVPLEEHVTDSFRITPEIIETLRETLKMYLGVKNYHNFTSRKKPYDPSAMRNILSFTASEPFVKDGLEYIILKVKGQSFMMHQIRKMIGLVVAILRGYTSSATIPKAFEHTRIDIPRAPGVGLMLGQVHYESYDQRYGSDGVHERLTWDEANEQIEKFCDEFIYPIVTKAENEERSFFNWLATLIFHTFDAREQDGEDQGSGAGRSQIGKAFARAVIHGRKPEDEVQDEDDDEIGGDDDEDSEEVKNSKRQKIG